jgi:hypothetical protein
VPQIELGAPLLRRFPAHPGHPVPQYQLAPHPEAPRDDAIHAVPCLLTLAAGKLFEQLGVGLNDVELEFAPQFLR